MPDQHPRTAMASAVQSRLRSVAGAVLLAIVCNACAAASGPVTVMCEKEDVLNADWAGPLTVKYSGDPEGQISVTSEHVNFTLPARLTERTGVVDGAKVTATAIQGSGETPSVMPEPQALLDCAKKTIQPEFEDDPDMQALALAGCVPKTAIGSSPIAVNASVSVALIPGEDPSAPDVVVEIKRSYLDVNTALGKSISIETYPKNCKLTGN